MKVIHALAEQSRASRMSFNDVVKMLAEAPTDSTTFIAERVSGYSLSMYFSVIHFRVFRTSEIDLQHCDWYLPPKPRTT